LATVLLAATGFLVEARAGVFCVDGDAATVCADRATAKLIVNATTATDTAIFVKPVCFAMKR
jgi:hypothetical protein